MLDNLIWEYLSLLLSPFVDLDKSTSLTSLEHSLMSPTVTSNEDILSLEKPTLNSNIDIVIEPINDNNSNLVIDNKAVNDLKDVLEGVMKGENVDDDEIISKEALDRLTNNVGLLNELSAMKRAELEFDEEEFEFYKSMVDSKMMFWTDAFIHDQGWEEHRTALDKLSTQMMFEGRTKEQMIDPLVGFLHDVGYSTRFIAVAIQRHFEEVGPSIEYFRASRHLFTDKDIELEMNCSQVYIDKLMLWRDKVLSGEMNIVQYGTLLETMMKKLGYSPNYIKYSVVRSVEFAIAALEDMANAGELDDSSDE